MSAAIELNSSVAFAEVMAEAGVPFQGTPVDDGQLHRFRVKGDKAGTENGWYILHNGDIPAGAFGCWKRSISESWCSKSHSNMTPAEREAFEHQQIEAKQQRQAEEKRKHEEAAQQCLALWDRANPTVSADHPYLAAKQIRAYGIRQLKDSLLIPVRDASKQLVSLQFIRPDGSKKFKTGGKKKGCYCSIGKPTTPTYICEGYATGSTIHEATGCGVVVAFDAGNIGPVAKELIRQYPDLEPVIAADNDHLTENNPGITKARVAARQLQLSMTYPVFQAGEAGSDFNDLAALQGLDRVKAALSCYQLVSPNEHSQQPEQPSDSNTPEAGADTPTSEEATRQATRQATQSSTPRPATPTGWMLLKDGVYQVQESDDRPPTKICGRVWVESMTRGLHGEGWGSVTCWIDRDGRERKRAIPQPRFHEQGNALAQELASDGLQIIPGKERRLAAYLGAFEPEQRIRAVDSLGWLSDKHGALAFVLPDRVISQSAETCVFQPEQYAPTVRTMTQSGTLKEWQQHVAAYCTGNPLLLFGLCASFAGVLIKPAGMDSGGFHIWGRSSGGKTTTGQVAASVWGCGADPADSPEQSYIRRWNATANASEALAAAHNDNLLVMDELHTCGAKDFGALIYNLMGGQGKAALRSDRTMRASRSWRVLVISTGEISAKAKIEEHGKAAKGGQLLRLIDLCIPNGSAIQDTQGQTPDAFARQLKRNCTDYYGSAGSAFLDALVGNASSAHELRSVVRKMVQKSAEELTPDQAEQEQRRAIQRFALVQTAGLLASRLGIIPQQPEQVCEAIQYVRDIWIGEHRGISDQARAVHSVREFILTHGSRFRDANNDAGAKIHSLAGYRDQTRNLWLFTDSGFKEACGGHDPKEVAKELSDSIFLFKNDGVRLKSKHRINGMGDGQIRLYAVKGEMLNDDHE